MSSQHDSAPLESALTVRRWATRGGNPAMQALMMAGVLGPVALVTLFAILSGEVMGGIGFFMLGTIGGLAFLDWVRNRASELPPVSLTLEGGTLKVTGGESREFALLSLKWDFDGVDLTLSDHGSSLTLTDLVLSADEEVALRHTLEAASRQATERHGEGDREVPAALRAALDQRSG